MRGLQGKEAKGVSFLDLYKEAYPELPAHDEDLFEILYKVRYTRSQGSNRCISEDPRG